MEKKIGPNIKPNLVLSQIPFTGVVVEGGGCLLEFTDKHPSIHTALCTLYTVMNETF